MPVQSLSGFPALPRNRLPTYTPPSKDVCKGLHYEASTLFRAFVFFIQSCSTVVLYIALQYFLYYPSFAPPQPERDVWAFSGWCSPGVNILIQCCIASSAMQVECAVEF